MNTLPSLLLIAMASLVTSNLEKEGGNVIVYTVEDWNKAMYEMENLTILQNLNIKYQLSLKTGD